MEVIHIDDITRDITIPIMGGRNHDVEQYFDHSGLLHRLDGPAEIYPDGSVSYWVRNRIPNNILDIVITGQLDFESFPSATLVENYHSTFGEKAYRLSPEDLILAKLKYSW